MQSLAEGICEIKEGMTIKKSKTLCFYVHHLDTVSSLSAAYVAIQSNTLTHNCRKLAGKCIKLAPYYNGKLSRSR